MKRVLFIAYQFPPQGGGGVQRTAKFVKYLPQFGWRPTVLTTSAPPATVDDSLGRDIPPQTQVLRVRGMTMPKRLPWRVRNGLKRWVLTVDEEIGWQPFAERAGRKLLQAGDFQAIYTTSAPYTDHLVGLSLRKNFHLPWIADFRDPWLDNIFTPFPTPLHRRICGDLERRIVQQADYVVVVSDPMRRQLVDRYPLLAPDKFIIIPNGFDPEDFEDVTPAPRDERLTIVYTGSLYGGRSARWFLEALQRAFAQGRLDRRSLQVRFVGAAGVETPPLVAEYGLTDVVTLLGYTPHQQSISHLFAADVLLLIIGDGPNSEVVLTGKLFEYLAARRPVLAMIPQGAAADLLAEAGVGSVVGYRDVDGAVDALVALAERYRRGDLRADPNAAVLTRLDRRNQARQLAELLDEIAER